MHPRPVVSPAARPATATTVASDLRIEIFPADLDPVVDFYTAVLGFTLVRDERHQEWPYVALRRGRARIGAAQRKDPVDLHHRRPPTGTEIVIEVDDVAALRDHVAARWSLEEDLVDRPWNLTDFRVLDPAGYYLRLTSTGA